MTFRMRLYDGCPYRVVDVSDELLALRDAATPVGAPSTEPRLGWFDIATTESPSRTYRCEVALAAEPAKYESDAGESFEHLGQVAYEAPPEPNEPGGPGVVLFTEDAILPAPGARPDPSELFGPCLLMVPAGRLRRALHGAHLMLGAPAGTRDQVTAGELPEPASFRFAAFLGEEHRFSTASPVPFLVRAGLVTAIVERTSGAAIARPAIL